jgi:hypothetical protein
MAERWRAEATQRRVLLRKQCQPAGRASTRAEAGCCARLHRRALACAPAAALRGSAAHCRCTQPVRDPPPRRARCSAPSPNAAPPPPAASKPGNAIARRCSDAAQLAGIGTARSTAASDAERSPSSPPGMTAVAVAGGRRRPRPPARAAGKARRDRDRVNGARRAASRRNGGAERGRQEARQPRGSDAPARPARGRADGLSRPGPLSIGCAFLPRGSGGGYGMAVSG